MSHGALRVIVMGGSLGGLTAALVLRDVGCEVVVHEQSERPLAGQGAGIVLNPATVRYFTQNGVLELDNISVASSRVRYLSPEGLVPEEHSADYRFSSYDALYRGLLDCFGEENYHLGSRVSGFDQDSEGVNVHFVDGSKDHCDLLVCTDGIRSTARRLLLPSKRAEYAGYVAWRGTVRAGDLGTETVDALHEAITYYVMPNSHFLTYPIPQNHADEGSDQSLFNWLWYRNVSEGAAFDDLMTGKDGYGREVSLYPGLVQDHYVEEMQQAAASSLPPQLLETVLRTQQPFIQAVFDMEVTRMAFGRICLLGDAAFTVRPHAAAGTAKAAEDAWQLGEALSSADNDVSVALPRWEARQLELGAGVLERTREAGRRSQFENSWRIGDRLPFGLYEEGDSVMPAASFPAGSSRR